MLAGLAAGCSSSISLIDHASGSSSAAHVGDTLDLQTASGRGFQATLTQVVDPAHAVSGSPPSGKRFVAVSFRFTNTSSQGLAGNSNSDANLVGSNGKIYLPAHQSLRECGNATVQYHVAAGQSATSCVAFEVKKSASITQVQFYPAAGSAKDYGQWAVP
jgi:hypothetical protein